MPVTSTPSIDENERKLLVELANGKWALRTRTGLAAVTEIPKPQVNAMVEDLRNRGLVDFKWVDYSSGAKKKRWYITDNGRAAIASM
jgi:DNA-binding PadR family transcriptional regulator